MCKLCENSRTAKVTAEMRSSLFAFLSVLMSHARSRLQLGITFSLCFKDMHMYLQASPKVEGCNPLYHTAMEMGIWLGLTKQKSFSSESCIFSLVYMRQKCVS